MKRRSDKSKNHCTRFKRTLEKHRCGEVDAKT